LAKKKIEVSAMAGQI